MTTIIYYTISCITIRTEERVQLSVAASWKQLFEPLVKSYFHNLVFRCSWEKINQMLTALAEVTNR